MPFLIRRLLMSAQFTSASEKLCRAARVCFAASICSARPLHPKSLTSLSISSPLLSAVGGRRRRTEWLRPGLRLPIWTLSVCSVPPASLYINMAGLLEYRNLAPKTKNLVVAGGLTAFVFGVYFYTMRAVGGTDELQIAIDKFEEKKNHKQV